MHIYSSTDCSPVGQLRELDNHSAPDNNSGLYVLPEPVKYCGQIVSITANGFFIKKSQRKQYTFRVSIFRQVCEDGIYIYRRFLTKRYSHTQENNGTHATIVRDDLGFHVMKNDRIGIQVDSECLRNDRCPFQPAIKSNSTSMVLYHSENSVNNLQPVTGIFLNIEVSIGNLNPYYCILLSFFIFSFFGTT